MKKILVIQTAFIGDVILATALLESLHRTFGDARIDILLRKGNEGLLEGHPFVGKVLVWNKHKHKYQNLWTLLKSIRQEAYDEVINVQRFAASGFLTAFSGAKSRVGFDKNPLSFLFSRKVKHHIEGHQYIHEIERNQKLIAHHHSLLSKPVLYPGERHKEEVKAFKQVPYFTMAPASVWPTKALPFEKWIELLSLTQNTMVYLLGAPGDVALCESLVSVSGRDNVQVLAGKISLLSAAALMQDAVMNYVNDSAPLHLASAMNAPVRAFYCSTLPSFGFGPLSDDSAVIEIREKLNCRPCGLHGKKTCPEGHYKCGHHIDVKEAISL